MPEKTLSEGEPPRGARGRLPARRAARLGAFLALGLALLALENTLFPLGLVLPIPGAKLGLANLATLAALEAEGFPAAAMISLGRVVLASVFAGTVGAVAFWLSLGGALLSLLGMGLARRLPGVSVLGTSMVGAVCHNLGQFAALGLVLPGAATPFLLPWLILLGLPAGLVTGSLAKGVLGRLGTVRSLCDQPDRYFPGDSQIQGLFNHEDLGVDVKIMPEHEEHED